MRAIAFEEFGDETVLDLVDLPRPNVGHFRALVRVKAAGVNPIDDKIRQGKMDGVIDTFFPVVPGWDLAGVVEEVHYTATGFQPGDEVIGCAYPDYLHHGSYAELVPVPVRALARKPRNATWEQSAGLPTAGLTAYQALEAIQARAGDTVLVHGASGGLGSLAVQIARILGAKVIGTASERNHEFLRDLGAQPVRYGDGWADRVRALAPDGVDGVVDLFGGGLLGESLPLLAPGVGPDRMVTVADRLHAADLGARWIGVRPDGGDLSQLAAWVEDGALTVHVSEVLPLADAATAHRKIREGHTRGKIVLTFD
jgi:NADPH:quinone reductase-like Zn-dependent oxidoreductase